MISTLLLGVGLLAATPPDDSRPVAADLAAYETVKAKVGRDADAHVKLALWCEAHGLSSERIKHLALAVLRDPKNATARGLMGLVDDHGRWQRPEAVSERVKADEALTAKLAEYNGRRERMPDTADAHWKLGLWCEQNGLQPEARAHFSSVTRLEPGNDAAWKRLGFKKHGKRWATDEQIKAEEAETLAQRKANEYWKPLLTKWRAWLHEKGRRDQAEDALAAVTDPRAVASVWAVFAEGDAAHQEKAVQVLGQIDAPAASRVLAMMSVYSRSPEIRRAATETLKRRDTRDFVGLLVGLIRDPLKYEVRPGNAPNSVGELFVEGEKYNVRRVYGVQPQTLARLTIPPRIFDASVPFDPYGAQNVWLATGPSTLPLSVPAPAGQRSQGVAMTTSAPNLNQVAAARDMQIAQAIARNQQIIGFSQQQLANDVAQVEAMNAGIRQANDATIPVLNAVTGQDLGESSEKWKAWWTDQKGYAYKSDAPDVKPTFTTFVENPYAPVAHNACFGAGTPVRTLDGSRPIESIRIGDQVLTQDTRTGRLSFTPIVAVFHNPPAPTLRIKLGDETVVATGIHRFWKAGKGWVMARELKPGDALRTIGGTARVGSVESDVVRPVFNLEVAEGQSFFVGAAGTLVHDNTLVTPAPAPFDAVADVEAEPLARRGE
jgi:hypothetical protein